MKIEVIRFVALDEDEAYFIRAMHHLAGGCLLLGAKDEALTAMVEVMNRAIEQRQKDQGQVSGDRRLSA